MRWARSPIDCAPVRTGATDSASRPSSTSASAARTSTGDGNDALRHYADAGISRAVSKRRTGSTWWLNRRD